MKPVVSNSAGKHALLNPKTPSLLQKRHPYTGNLFSGTVTTRVYIVETTKKSPESESIVSTLWRCFSSQ